MAVSKQMLGYSTSGYMQVFLSPEGSSLVEKNAGAFDSLMFAKDPEAWKEHLCAEGALQKFLEAGKELPVADWISPEELATHQRILKGGYDGVFNWYKAIAFLDPAKEDQDLSSEDQKITVPTLFIATTKDYAIIPAVQVHMTREAAQDNLKIETLDTGHWAMLEAKETVEKMFEEFASGLSM
jgi:pimeloyl-ACP methyl ester carboxylesterase